MKIIRSIALFSLLIFGMCDLSSAQVYPGQPSYGGPGVAYGPSMPVPAPAPLPSMGANGQAGSVTLAGNSLGYQPMSTPFGPQVFFEGNSNEGLGFTDSYYRVNALLPRHLVPNQSVLFADLAGAVTTEGEGAFNFGVGYRSYNQLYNRVTGVNAYYDMDAASGFNQYRRIGVGFESLGRFLDFRLNGYFLHGEDSALISSTEIDNCTLVGNSILVTMQETREAAFSGIDAEAGGPLPFIGRYGLNGYVGGYYLKSGDGDDTVGVSLRGEALITDGISANVTHTTDDLLGQNTWAGFTVSLPNWRTKRFMKPRIVRERLGDPVRRSSRIHTNIDVQNVTAPAVNPLDGEAYEIVYVDPNGTFAGGSGTFEDPYTSVDLLMNDPSIDIIRIDPRLDGEAIAVTGGISLFDNQALISGGKAYDVFTSSSGTCTLPVSDAYAALTAAEASPIIYDPTIMAGDSVIRLANNNTIWGMTIDASDRNEVVADRIYGTAISNPLPIVDFNISCNTFQNYRDGVVITDMSGTAIFEDNTLNGVEDVSETGFSLTTLTNSDVDLLVRGNTATNNMLVGLDITAGEGSRISANNPDGFSSAAVRGGAAVTDTQPTGIVGNTTTGNGEGIRVTALSGSTVNAVIDENVSSGNTLNGISITSDDATVILPSVAGNTALDNIENGLFIRYTNGGQVYARTEDINGDGFLSFSEDLNGNGILDAGEDINGNGLLDLSEDFNNNGRLDQGIVSNTFNNNGVAGICIFGDGSGDGYFDIGGPTAVLGNTLLGNTDAGLLVDLTGTATAQTDAMFNVIGGGGGGLASLTIVLDFIDPAQGTVIDGVAGLPLTAFDVTDYGFAPGDTAMVENAVLAQVRENFYSIPTSDVDPRSAIAPGMELDIDFVIGDQGVAPINGATEYYAVSIGDSNGAGNGAGNGGIAWISAVRDANGVGPNLGFTNGDAPATVYVDSLPTFGVTPADALTSGNLLFTQRAIGLVTTHEIGHNLSLDHVFNAGSVTPTGLTPVMATPALEPANTQALVDGVEFSYSGTGADGVTTLNNVAQLVSAVGTRVASAGIGTTRDGVRISATDNARFLPSTFTNNTITTTVRDGLSINVADNAVAQDVTIQSNTIQTAGRDGIRLHANGANALIEASNTIGGSGTNTIGGVEYAQANTISNNEGNGITVFVEEGTVNGNAIANTITDNGGNGIALLIDPSGTIDFGDLSEDRVITANTITGNGQAGILLRSNVTPSTMAELDAIITGNTISGNGGGGIIMEQTGLNNTPPLPPALTENNVMNVTIGGAAEEDANTLTGNANVGIAAIASGTAKQEVSILGNTITGTTAGADARFSGDGIYLGRNDSAFMQAEILNNVSSNNEGEGLDVVVQGNDQFDLNQPMSGMPSSLLFSDNTFDSNGGNGVGFRLFGDSVFVADGYCNTITNNALDGINITTSQNATFGDATDSTLLPGDLGYIAPIGRRSILNGNIITGNGDDGVEITANDGSRALVEITGELKPDVTPASAHTPAIEPGDTLISGNGGNGVEINSDGGQSDVLITGGTGETIIEGNGEDGIQINASGPVDGSLTFDQLRDRSSNISVTVDDVDIISNTDDGIEFNSRNFAQPTLTVENSRIQNNGDDGIHIFTEGHLDPFGNAATFGVSRPVVTVSNSTIGGTRDGVNAGNGGDGVEILLNGEVATATENALGDGPVLTATFSGNEISNNAGRGANIRLTGATGTRFRENGANVIFDPTTITFNQNNNISSNGMEGIFYEADPLFIQNREVLLGNTGFPNDDRQPGFNPDFTFNPDGSQAFYDPGLFNFTNLNVGTFGGNAAYMDPYLNLRTENNSFLTVVDNTIQNNGTGTVQGEGLFIRVGTNSYVAADVRNNAFGGNLNEDFRTESFLTAGLNTNDFIDRAGVGTFDSVFLDDTAQLDLRFTNNFGNQIAPIADGATYTNPDLAKLFPNSLTFDPAIAPTTRDAFLFQVDGGPFLDNPNNQFTNFGLTQDIDATFATGNFFLRGVSDPAFPNAGFPPPLP